MKYLSEIFKKKNQFNIKDLCFGDRNRQKSLLCSIIAAVLEEKEEEKKIKKGNPCCLRLKPDSWQFFFSLSLFCIKKDKRERQITNILLSR